MAWISAIAAIGGGLLSNQSARRAQGQSQYRYQNTSMPGVGQAYMQHQNGTNRLVVDPDRSFGNFQNWNVDPVTGERSAGPWSNRLDILGTNALDQYEQGQQNQLGQSFLRGAFTEADQGQLGMFGQMQGALQGSGPYQQQNFMGGVNNGLLQNIDPTQMGNDYTNMLRQQALPGEQQAANSALSRLHASGRLGTTGGMQAYGQLQDAQSQADLGRQVAGQQFGLQQGLMAQQGYDQARQNQMGLMGQHFGLNQQGMMNQFGMDQGMFGRTLDAFNSGSDMTQDRFGRAMQLFGGENAMNQQYLSDYMGLLGANQSQSQTAMDLARIGASVGQAQTTANANAAQMRNSGNQDMIAGFMQGISNWNQNRDN